MSTKSRLHSFFGSAKKTILGLTPLPLHTTYRCHVDISESVAPSLHLSLPNRSDEPLPPPTHPAAATQMLFGDPTTIEPDLAIEREVPVRTKGTSHSEILTMELQVSASFCSDSDFDLTPTILCSHLRTAW